MRILAFGIHPDDIELGCGGTVALAVSMRHEVYLADLTRGDSSSNGTEEERAGEATEAGRILGVTKRMNLGMPDTKIQSENLEYVKTVTQCIRDCQPQVAIIPSSDDDHPDHALGGALIERALYLAGISGYDNQVPAWRPDTVLIYMGRKEYKPHLIVDVTKMHDTKMKAIRVHRSQFTMDEGRVPTALNSPDFLTFIEARSRVFGRRIGATFGEPFRLLNPLRVSEFSLFTSA